MTDEEKYYLIASKALVDIVAGQDSLSDKEMVAIARTALDRIVSDAFPDMERGGLI